VGQISIAITKRVAFRDATQEFQNVYTYGSLDINPSAGVASDLIDEVTTKEKAFHGTNVSFVYGRCWSSGGTKAENQMITEKPLTGTGGTTPNASMDRERAFLVQWDAGIDTLGRKVRLKKWYHSCGAFGSVAVSGTVLTGETGLTSGQRSTISGLADALTRIGTALVWGLKAESGRERDGGAPVAHRYLEHHQLGDQWRG
jgi:hypothetical protein